jgi:hypothetical protein
LAFSGITAAASTKTAISRKKDFVITSSTPIVPDRNPLIEKNQSYFPRSRIDVSQITPEEPDTFVRAPEIRDRRRRLIALSLLVEKGLPQYTGEYLVGVV